MEDVFTVSWISLAVDDNKHDLNLRESLLGLTHVPFELSRFDVLDEECTTKDHSYNKFKKKRAIKTWEINWKEM